MIWWFEKKRGVSVFITLVGAVLIFWISSIPGKAFLGTLGITTILYHLLAFFFFSAFVFISIVIGRKNHKFFLIAFLISTAYALTDEIHQFFIPGRACAFFDFGLDLTGIVFSFIIYLIIIFRR